MFHNMQQLHLSTEPFHLPERKKYIFPPVFVTELMKSSNKSINVLGSVEKKDLSGRHFSKDSVNFKTANIIS